MGQPERTTKETSWLDLQEYQSEKLPIDYSPEYVSLLSYHLSGTIEYES